MPFTNGFRVPVQWYDGPDVLDDPAYNIAAMSHRRTDSIVGIGRLIVDFETYSEVDLTRVGSYRYAIDPSTDVLCASIRIIGGDEVVKAGSLYLEWREIVRLNGGHDPIDSRATLLAFNDRFDWAIWKYVLTPRYGWPDPNNWKWEDLSQRAAYANLPGSLDEVSRVLGTPGKDPEGYKLMMKLCKPARAIIASDDPRRLHTIENLDRLLTYCGQDTECEAALDTRLPHLPEYEQKVMLADRAMNSRGIRVNVPLVNQMADVALEYRERLQEELRETTHGDVGAVTQLPAMKAWIMRQCNLVIREGPGALDRYAIDAFLDGEYYDGSPLLEPLPQNVRRVLTIRREVAKSSLAKLAALLGAVDPADQRVRGMFQYYGARMTGRWSGKIIQPQNLPKGVLKGAAAYDTALAAIHQGVDCLTMLYDQPDGEPSQVMDVLSSCLRACLIPSEGNEFVIVDYSAIEARVAAWLANETWMLDAYRRREDLYKIMASLIYSLPIEHIIKSQRDDGKMAELSCQYGLGGEGLKRQAKRQGRVMTSEFAKRVVDTYRQKHPNITRAWRELEQRAMSAIRAPGTVASFRGLISFKFDGHVLKLRLPSQRCIWFNKATIEPRPVPWDPNEMRDKVCYWGEDSLSGRYSAQEAWGGDFMAISCQATARDLIAAALVRTEAERLNPVLTVHDEIGFDLPYNVRVRRSVEQVSDLMCELPPWASGLPIAAEGFSSFFYRK